MRIASLLAGGTELVCALGRGAELVGRSHECDRPAGIARLPVLSRPTFDVAGASGEIDRRVRAKLAAGEPLYAIDAAALAALAPDLVITQAHCDVCAVGPVEVNAAHAFPGLEGLRTVAMSGGTLAGVLRDFATVARAIGAEAEGARLVEACRERERRVRATTAALPRPSVVCLEWTDPPFAMGNWGPELVELAGGRCLLGRAGEHSTPTSWQAVLDADSDVLIVAPCGFDLARARAEMPGLAARPGFAGLRAVRAGRVFVADGNRWFNRSGPALWETLDLLAEMLHTERIPLWHAGHAYERWGQVQRSA